MAALLALATGAQAATLNVDGTYELTGTTSESYTGVSVGKSVAGTLNIKDSAALTSSGNFYINDKSGLPLSTVNLTGGTLTHNYTGGDGFFIGWWGQGVMNISGGTANLAQLNFYTGELNLSGSGTLNVPNNNTLVGKWDRGVNSFAISGGTANLRGVQLTWDISTLTLSGGTLDLGAGGISGSGMIDFSGGTLKLSNNGAITRNFDTDTVDALFFDGVQQAAGTWGKTGSGATHINNTYFTGTGVLTVGASSTPYQTWSGNHAFTDFNSEGVAYGMAWILGASTHSSPSSGLLPAVTDSSGGFFTLHFTRVLDIGPTAHLYVEFSDDLGGWTPVEVLIPTVVPGTVTEPGSGIVFDVTTSGGLYDIQARIPFGGSGKRFARLAATE